MIKNIGNGIDTKFNIEHNFGTDNVFVQVKRNSNGTVVYPDITFNNIKAILEFAESPQDNEFKVVIIRSDLI